MSQENVEIVQRAFDAFHSGDADRAEALATIDPNVVYTPVEDGPSYGLNAIRDQFERWESSWEELVETAEEFIDAGDLVVVTALYRGRGQGSGAPVEARFYAVYTLRDGRVVRVNEFTDRAEALEAAGLRGVGQNRPSPYETEGHWFESSRARFGKGAGNRIAVRNGGCLGLSPPGGGTG